MTPRRIGVGVVATVLAAAVSTMTVAAAHGMGDHARRWSAMPGLFAARAPVTCAAPNLAGTVVDASLLDMNGMGAMMSLGGNGWGAMMSPGSNGWGTMMGPGGDGSGAWHPAMMRIALTSGQASAGQVSLRVTNLGVVTHELVVLPLPSGQPVGSRVAGSDGKVDETGSLGEVSSTCAAGAGDGLEPGSTGWTTLQLTPGRYELVCNLRGHYAAGMHAELDITG